MAATTTRDVAAAAGVAVGTVFLHFPDRAALVESVLEAHIAAALVRAGGVRHPDAPVIEQVLAITRVLWDAYDAEPDLSREVLRETLFIGSAGRPLGRQLDAFRDEIIAMLAGAVARGELPRQDLMVSFMGFFGLYFSLLLAGLRGDVAASAREPLLRAFLQRLWGHLPDPREDQ